MSSLWSSLGLPASQEEAASSFGAFLKTASSAIESRIDTVLGGDEAKAKKPGDAADAEPAGPSHDVASDIAEKAAAGFAAFSKQTDDFFSSMLGSFTAAASSSAEEPAKEPAKEQEQPVTTPDEEAKLAAPEMKLPSPSPPKAPEPAAADEEEAKPLDFREEAEPRRSEADGRPARHDSPVASAGAEATASPQAGPDGWAPDELDLPDEEGQADTDASNVAADSLASPAKDAGNGQSRASEVPHIVTTEESAPAEALPIKAERSPAEPSPGRLSTDSARRVNGTHMEPEAASSPAPSSEPAPSSPQMRSPSPVSAKAATPTAVDPALQHVVEQRERQLMTAMEENRNLHVLVEQLREQISALESRPRASSDAGGGAQVAELRRLLEEREEEVTAKEQVIVELMAEGEKLSKAELKASQSIKDLKKEKKEQEKLVQDLNKKMEASVSEIAELKLQIGRFLEGEKKLQDAVRTLNELNDQHNKQIVKLEGEASTLKDDKSNLQMALERAWAELSETRRLQASQNSQAQSEALEKEIKTNQDLHLKLEQARKDFETLESSSRKEILDLRTALARSEEDSGWKEDNLRKELEIMQSRLRAAENRNEDLSASVQESTRPLLRQIEALQTQQQQSQKNWEQAEKTLTARLHEAEMEREKSSIRERGWSERVNELTTRVATLESQLSIERQDKSRLTAELEVERTRMSDFQAQNSDLSAKLEIQKSAHNRALEDAKDSFQKLLRQRLQEEREQWEQKRKEEERARQNEVRREPEKSKLKLDTQRLNSGRESSVDRFSGTITSAPTQSPSSIALDSAFGSATIAGGGPMNPASVIDRLHGMVKQLEGQVSGLQTQLQMASRTRDELADELVKLTSENESLKQSLAKVEHLERELLDLNTRYTASLELLGERTEQVEELRQDLLDVKSMYKEQIADLVEQLAQRPQ
ncbi:TATA element modulatory factor 1 TATA binding-domain-containing protein [Hyaloraphidium curvatum]|nr:TATA element modulatory factor 1 TATA binding-domain-containing protein [Hyaloraphidium curvatum]